MSLCFVTRTPAPVDYSNYLTAFGVAGVVGQIVAIPFFSSKLRWSDTTILAVTTSTSVANQGGTVKKFAQISLKSLIHQLSACNANP